MQRNAGRRRPNRRKSTEQARSIMEIIQEKLLEEYGPASVAIDQNYEIIYHNGPTNRYLRQPRGVPTQNLLELLPENLRSRIRGALYRSGREERPGDRQNEHGRETTTRKDRSTLRITKAAENLSIVVFQEKGVSLERRKPPRRSMPLSSKRRRSTSSKASCPRPGRTSRATSSS